MYVVYIIQSKISGKYYIGMTADIDQRLLDHNRGANRFTKGKGPWTMIYKELFQDKKSAWFRERQIKSYKGGNAFKKLISHGGIA